MGSMPGRLLPVQYLSRTVVEFISHSTNPRPFGERLPGSALLRYTPDRTYSPSLTSSTEAAYKYSADVASVVLLGIHLQFSA